MFGTLNSTLQSLNINTFTESPVNESSFIFNRYVSFQDFYFDFAPVIYYAERIIPPIWFIVGFPGNILAFIVWIQPRMRPSSGCYLAILALGDFFFLVLQLVFMLHNTYSIHVLYYPVVCQGFPIIFYAMQYLNPLLVLGFTVERYIAICHPFQREKYCSTHRAIMVVISLVALSFLIHAVQGYFWEYRSKTKDCDVRPSVLEGKVSIWIVWTWLTELLAFGLVPVAILVLNIRVILEAKKIKESEKKMLCLLNGQKVQRKSSVSATTFMLLAVSFYMIFTTLPVTLLYVLDPLFPAGSFYMWDHQIQHDVTWQRHLTFMSIRTVIERVCISHYACNFYIYLATGQVFRKELQAIFVRTCCKGLAGHIQNTELDDLLSTYKKPEVQNGAVAHL